MDTTAGRYADVEVLECSECASLWLRYAVEYEAFSRSGRWARGLVDAATARIIAAEDAPAYLAALPWMIFGGSYFGTSGRRGSGALPW